MDIAEQLGRRWLQEVWNDRRDETVTEMVDGNSIGHMEGCKVQGPEQFRAVRDSLIDAIPDLRVTIEDCMSCGGRVALRWSLKGTHQGHGLGMAPTSRPVSIRGMSWLTFADGRITEGWDSWNLGALLAELNSCQPTGSD